MGQYIQEGRRNLIETVLNVEEVSKEDNYRRGCR